MYFIIDLISFSVNYKKVFVPQCQKSLESQLAD